MVVEIQVLGFVLRWGLEVERVAEEEEEGSGAPEAIGFRLEQDEDDGDEEPAPLEGKASA